MQLAKRFGPPAWGPLGKKVYEDKYSRLKDDGRKERWEDTVKRVVDGNLALVDDRFIEPKEREKLYELLYTMKLLPAGRQWRMSGVKGRQFLFNCHSAGFPKDNPLKHFTFLFDELMKGGGVGTNYSNKYIDVISPVKWIPQLYILCDESHKDYESIKPFVTDRSLVRNAAVYVVEDSREGWCEALSRLLNASFGEFPYVVIDVSKVRPKGEPIKTFGGVSSGPLSLVTMLSNIATFLSGKWNQKLTSLDVMQLDHEIAQCVISGNVRRSARMAVKHWKDPDIFDFIKAKSDHTSHWTTNISVEVDDEFNEQLKKYPEESRAHTILNAISAGMWANGEPGFWNSSKSAEGELNQPFSPNPCGEIALEAFENCNLGHINLSGFKLGYVGASREMLEAFRLMTRFLIRSTFSDITDKTQRAIVNQNRRIGVGILGLHNWCVQNYVKFSQFHKSPLPNALMQCREACEQEAMRYARQLRIPAPIKTTCIAPTGTICNLPGVASGCQPIFARYFKRRMIYAKNNPEALKFIKQGYEYEDSIYERNSYVFTFYCKESLVADVEKRGIALEYVEDQNEIPPDVQLEIQKCLQTKYANNAISYTINFDPKRTTPDVIYGVLREYLPYLKGTTMMPDNNSRPQTPLERITRAEFEEWEKKGLGMVSDAERECQNGACPVT